MADFSSTEKTNAAWKHLFSIVGTANGTGAGGKFWYEENLSASHVVVPTDIWSDTIPAAANLAAAHAVASSGTIVEDRALGENITLVPNGLNWDITASTIEPKIGFQITNVHPNPTYVKSITAVVDNGGGSYTITLNSNTGVSAGSAVLHSRIYLTLDPTSNGLSWFARQVQGNNFSAQIKDFIQPQRFGKGYTVRLFRANGTEIVTTEGAWIFNWQQGLLLFANGFTAANLGYAQPLYIEAFKYTGLYGGGGASLPAGNIHDTLRFDGTNWIPTSAVQSDDTNLYVQNRLSVSGSLQVASGVAPSGTMAPGDEGELRWSGQFLYLCTASGWRRSNLQLF
jgi:hypothetical protein